MTLDIPKALADTCRKDANDADWLERLPKVVADLERRWSLTLQPPFRSPAGSCSWVAPVLRADGSNAVLKVGLPHMEARHEIAGLRFWDGRMTVRLIDADEELNAMLLESCVPGTTLRSLPEPEQVAVISELMPQLWRVPPARSQFRPLSYMFSYWSEETLADANHWPDTALVRQGLDLFQELTHSAEEQVLLFTDLHAGNILRARRAPWLAIDPKPFVGDPAFDATQHLFNCTDSMLANPDRTISDFASRLGLQTRRVRLWTFARAAAQPRQQWQNDLWLTIARKIAP